MKWTTETPTIPGFYWFKDGLTEDKEIVKVFIKNDKLFAENDELFFQIDDWAKQKIIMFWAGPLPEPEE